MDTDSRDTDTPVLDEFAQFLNASIHPPNELSVPRCYPDLTPHQRSLLVRLKKFFLFLFAGKRLMWSNSRIRHFWALWLNSTSYFSLERFYFCDEKAICLVLMPTPICLSQNATGCRT